VLKDLGYDGTYRDEKMSISVMLENPLKYGLEATELAFSIVLRAQNGSPSIDDFAFYVMDESNRLYNTRIMPCPNPEVEPVPDDEPIRQPDRLIVTDFNHEFLFQDLRIAFYYPLCRKINIIELKR